MKNYDEYNRNTAWGINFAIYSSNNPEQDDESKDDRYFERLERYYIWRDGQK